MTQTQLFFGMNIPTGGQVTQADWRLFVDEIVTPRFGEGFTAMSAQGQWKGKDGEIAREQSRVLIFLYAYSERREMDLQQIMDTYKSRFQQEAVMRVDAKIRLGFY